MIREVLVYFGFDNEVTYFLMNFPIDGAPEEDDGNIAAVHSNSITVNWQME